MVPLLSMFARMMARARETSIGRNQGMHMALKTRRWTRADLERFPNDGNRYEVIGGELLVSPAPRPKHAEVVWALRRALEPYCDRERLGSLGEVSAFVVEDSEAIPDLVVRKRTSPPPADWALAAIPLLVVEVTSESTRRHDEIKKRPYYLDNKIPEYWIVDGDARTVRVITPDGDRVESQVLQWHPPGAFSPLAIDLVDLFEQALGPS